MSNPKELYQLLPDAIKYLPPQHQTFKLDNAKERFQIAFHASLPGFQMLPEYKEVISWLEDNQGKGLSLIGANGRGKSLIANYVIPLLFSVHHGKNFTRVNAQEMNDMLDQLLPKKFLIIDDIGTEGQKLEYGNRRWALFELLDNAEKNKHILILTSNLDADDIQEKYGILSGDAKNGLRIRERIRATCKVVIFKGESLRK